MRVIAKKLVLRLPDLPQPWDVEELCRALERSRRRSLTLYPVDIPAMPSGFWYGDGESDHIFYGSSVSGYYRDHIILHEICHMLAGHGVAPRDLAAAHSAGPFVRGQGQVLKCHNTEEEIAETFSAMVLKRAGRMRHKGVGVVESRAQELLGVPCARRA
ncbi:hypothetical protein [Streptomyces sp. NRRL S-1813]|uniref:hypothetical protein n=1 Tax=Streptomyces sp. NRRL S-1813 TaxID=1463888 RepID=UPI0004C7BAF4|nr:hypothetical protein [Streptomyces sp. NRRL S-1813]